MKSSAKRLLSVLLLAVLSASAACGDAGAASAPSAAESTGSAETAAVEETTAVEYISDDLPELDFGGETVTIHVRGDSNSYGEVFAELDGEVLNDAVYNRNKDVEERLNAEIEVFRGPGWAEYGGSVTKLKSSILAGDNAYQIIAGWAAVVPTMALDGCFTNLNSKPYLDTSKPWWTRSATTGMNVGGMLFFVTGDVSILTDLGGSYVMFMNDKLAENYGVKGVAGDVYSGAWTLDKLIGYLKDTGSDLNGNGSRDEEDMFGLVLDMYNSSDAFLTAADIHQVIPDDEGNLVYVDQTERLTRLMEKIYPLYYGEDYNSFMQTDVAKGVGMFAAGHGMFTVRELDTARDEFRAMEDSYTILPLPKLDDVQQDYMVCSFNGATIWGIPVSNTTPDASLAVMEALACISYNSVSPVYFETCLQEKFARNEDTLKMLEIIRDNMFLDSENLYHSLLGDSIYAARNLISSKKSDVASYTAKNAGKIEKAIAKTIEKFSELRDQGY
ncbi:MAG: hypothetical protein IJT56_04830 [Clostridia bacterium]|nr:hypothetical protein [Clostridia bacterium]